MHVLAIDQGTSGTKALVVTAGHVRSAVEVPLRPTYGAGGSVETSPEALWDSVLAAGRGALAQAGVSRVDVVTLANQGESVLAWDRVTGAALSPVIGWQDRRSEAVCRRLGDHAALIARRTGLVLDPYFTAPKMVWLRENLTSRGVVTTTDTWLVHRLCGAFVTDAATASRSLLLDPRAGAWDEELLEIFGLAGEELPRIVRNDEVVGETHAFGASAPVAGLMVDQQAALAGQRCLTAGDAKCTYGTGAFLLGNAGSAVPEDAQGLSSSIAWSVTGGTTFCLDGQVPTCGSAARWMVESGWLSSVEALDAECGEDSGGVVFVPALAGHAAPRWNPAARASLTGLGLDTRPGQLVCAVLEGIAAQVAELVTGLETVTGSRVERLLVDGGMTASRRLMQVQADLLQVPVDCFESPHATAMGAAAMGLLALEPGRGLAGVTVPTRTSATYEPRWSADRAAEQLAAWRAAVDRTSTLERV